MCRYSMVRAHTSVSLGVANCAVCHGQKVKGEFNLRPAYLYKSYILRTSNNTISSIPRRFFGLILDCHPKWLAAAHHSRPTRAGNDLIPFWYIFWACECMSSQLTTSMFCIYAYLKLRPNDIIQSILDPKKTLDANQTHLAQSVLIEMVTSSQRKSLQTCVRASAKIDHCEKQALQVHEGSNESRPSKSIDGRYGMVWQRVPDCLENMWQTVHSLLLWNIDWKRPYIHLCFPWDAIWKRIMIHPNV